LREEEVLCTTSVEIHPEFMWKQWFDGNNTIHWWC
jgi:hypothetical protein